MRRIPPHLRADGAPRQGSVRRPRRRGGSAVAARAGRRHRRDTPPRSLRPMTSSLSAPPTLRQIQEWMAASILPGAPADSSTSLDAWLHVPPPARIADRLAVYRDGYPVRVAESLAETYPAVAHALGDRAFAALVDRYVAAVPQTSYNLNDAGAELPAFLRDDPCMAAL